MTTADLLYSDVETDLRASVRDLLNDRCEPASLLARVESDEPYDLELWHTLARELGAAGLAVPEELGGQGASTREVALVLEELGRSVAPVPFLGSAVLATSALLACDTASAEVADLVRKLASGTSTGALAVPLSTMADAEFPTAVTAAADGTLSGTVRSVADGTAADVFVVPATGPDGPGLYAVEATAAEVSAPVSFDLTRPIADVTFGGAAATRLAGSDRAPGAVTGALSTGAGLLASEQLGLAQWCLDETVEYLKGRYQFGRPVGSFQALKHRLADLWLELVGARAAARYAADTLARGDADAPVAVAMAQSYCAETAVHAAEECIQLHGGIGMTWEHPAHLYLKRAKASQVAFGAPGRHRAALGDLVDLPG
ncbi:alkylation response protein AidB-like acyl-CoA dehydrogenase [Prauserella sediminis]|uniref:Alkylation response protein AidB-like acyl-CoA dehydrogenase n=1 Tax=Prauserella sediminis TaxID=577680 RepID=A0A839XTU7_9PSEU|nr:acyl-CoA dehydrogenase family protein [Prauserella sediminis]MBB3666141.1 alkylation response protein AidB-like acyl-CoA dehydrogenase [Prauserella sediminis]